LELSAWPTSYLQQVTNIVQVLSANDVGSLISPPLGGVVYRQIGRLGLMLVSILFLGVSLVMTLMMDEKQTSTRLALVQKRRRRSERQNFSLSIASSDSDEALPMITAEGTMDESSEKFHPQENNHQPYVFKPARNWLLRTVPILPCLRHPALIVAVGVCAVQAALLGAFDATIPLEAKRLFDFGATIAGLLFIPIGCARLAAGPLGGWAVDRYGPKRVAVICYSALVPVLLLFDLLNPQPRSAQIALYCVLLTLCGIGMGGVATAGFVEAGNIVEQYHESNPKHFGVDGPFALLYGLNLMVFSLGMTLGSFMTGDFRQWAGYGNMMAVLAGLSCLAAFAAHIWMAEKSSM
jgi:MFS family permease